MSAPTPDGEAVKETRALIRELIENGETFVSTSNLQSAVLISFGQLRYDLHIPTVQIGWYFFTHGF